MRTILILFILFTNYLSFSQEEQGNYAEAASTFMQRYNMGDYGAIFDSFNVDMQKALPREQTLAFFAQNVNSLMGNIEEMQFARIDNGTHIYRADFERAVAEVVISLTPQQTINGFAIKPVNASDIPVLKRNVTPMILPFNEEWFVFWGGTTVEQNYHVDYPDQQYAYDILMVADGASYVGDPKKNENYLVFGKEVIAPCNAKVAHVITGVHDNIPGELNPEQLTGNTVVLETENGEYILLAHLKEGSIVVEEGQEVLQGEVLAQCGNSGNSTEPHLHLSLQNHVDMLQSTGAKLYFDRIMVNGEIKSDYLPVKEDLITNIN
ncbi:peptidoglycan DD-metalloendopeptidase family protein [Maribacter halichondriae]|uniref:peptidoglycan DD-metalloendopeptidase family protein n=1 Tax=Maribacter halichondriae TaxID=2980554 RepID=UPI00235A3400|nr:peptidoglycan DD-metalloendopeptidase family protein [Maribacter sp. Hal144]